MDFQEGATLATQSILGPALCNEGSLCIANSEAVGGGATNAGAVFRGIDGGIKVPAQWVGGKGLACTVVGNTHGAILARQQRWLLVGDHSHTSWCGLWLVVNHWVSVHVQVIGVSEARRVPHKLGVSQATGAQTTTAQQGVGPHVCEEPLQAQQHAAAVWLPCQRRAQDFVTAARSLHHVCGVFTVLWRPVHIVTARDLHVATGVNDDADLVVALALFIHRRHLETVVYPAARRGRLS